MLVRYDEEAYRRQVVKLRHGKQGRHLHIDAEYALFAPPAFLLKGLAINSICTYGGACVDTEIVLLAKEMNQIPSELRTRSHRLRCWQVVIRSAFFSSDLSRNNEIADVDIFPNGAAEPKEVQIACTHGDRDLENIGCHRCTKRFFDEGDWGAPLNDIQRAFPEECRERKGFFSDLHMFLERCKAVAALEHQKALMNAKAGDVSAFPKETFDLSRRRDNGTGFI